MRKDAARTAFGRRLRCTSYAGMNQIKFAGSVSISAQPLRTPGRAECTSNRFASSTAREAFALLIRKHIMHIPRRNALLLRLPEGRVQQVGVVLHEDLAHQRVAQ